MPTRRRLSVLSLFLGVAAFPLSAAAEVPASNHAPPPPAVVVPPAPVVATRSSVTHSPTTGTVRIDTTMSRSTGARADGAPQTVMETRTTVTKKPVGPEGQAAPQTVIHYTKTITKTGAGDDLKVSVVRRKRIAVGEGPQEIEKKPAAPASKPAPAPTKSQATSSIAPQEAPPLDQHVKWLKERWAEGVSQLAPGEPYVGGRLVQRTDTPFRAVPWSRPDVPTATRPAGTQPSAEAVEAGTALPPEVESKVRFDTMKVYSVVHSPKGFEAAGVEAAMLPKEKFLYLTIAGRAPWHDVTVMDAKGNTLAHGTASTENFFGWTNDIPTATTLRKVRWDDKPAAAAR